MTLKTAGDRKFRRSPKSPLLPHKHHYHRESFASEAGFDGASYSGAVCNLSTTVVGAGIMALPAILKQLGLIPGLILIVLGSCLTEFSIDMLLRFSKSSKSSSYAGLVGDSFGGLGRTMLQLCVVVNNLGMLVVYLIIIGDVLAGTWTEGLHHRGLMEEWVGQQWWTSRSSLLLLTTFLVLVPLISLKRVEHDVGSAGLSNGAIGSTSFMQFRIMS